MGDDGSGELEGGDEASSTVLALVDGPGSELEAAA